MKVSFSGPLFNLEKFGKLGFFLNGRLVDSNGWLNGERRYMPEDGWEIEVYREWYSATFDPKDPLVIPLPDSLHTGDGEIIPMDWEKMMNMNFKLVYQPFPKLTLSLNSFFSDSYGKGYSSSWRFCPDGNSSWANQSTSYMLVMTHSLYENLFYNLRYSFQRSSSQSYTFENSDDPRYQTTAVNAWDPGKLTGYDYGGISSWNRRSDEQLIQLVNGDITWQINNIIQIRSGFEAKSYSLHYQNSPMREILGYETMQFPWSRSEIFDFEIPYGVVKIDGSFASELEEKPIQKYFVNAGVYVINPEILNYIPKNKFYNMTDFIKDLKKNNKKASEDCFVKHPHCKDQTKLSGLLKY